MREDERVPRYVKPSGMPPEVEAIIDILGNRVRQAIVRELASHGPATTAHLDAAIGARRDTTIRHLRALEDAGLVDGQPPLQERTGRVTTWTLDRPAVERHLARLHDYVLGE